MITSQPLFSQGVESLLRGQAGLKIVGREKDATRAFNQIRKLKPDVVILDTKDLASAPFLVVARLLQAEVGIKIIAMTLENQTIRVFRGEQRKAICVDDLVEAIEENHQLRSPKALGI
jgi:DNA-binding NarL/FixJ family response regulator